jgi:hypothetical protein
MIIECGPDNDRRILNLSLPKYHKIQPWNKNSGVLVSGGIDSALLYYLLLKQNQEQGNTHNIKAYTILRKEGSRQYALPVINHINSLFNLPEQELITVGDNTLDEPIQVSSGMVEITHKKLSHVVYVGAIDTLDIHLVGWHRIPVRESDRFKYPLMNLNKSHIIDLVYQLGQQHLFKLTHSCIYETGRCNICNGCNERQWGFDQLGRTDPGTI